MTRFDGLCDLLVGVDPLSPVICGARLRSSEEVSMMLEAYCLCPLVGNSGG